jgi:uncharacterized protein DUF1566
MKKLLLIAGLIAFMPCGCSLIVDPGSQGTNCTEDNECGVNYICDLSSGSGICRQNEINDGGSDGQDGGDEDQLKDNGEPCDSDDECLSDHCQNQVCCLDTYTCCSNDDHCAPGVACDTEYSFACYGDCFEGGEDDNKCRTGFHCEAAGCDADVTGTGSCNEDSDCASKSCHGIAPGATCCQHAGLCCETSDDCQDFFSSCNVLDHVCEYIPFTLPDTGQNTCYDNSQALADCDGASYDGQDADFQEAGLQHSYTDPDPGTGEFTDNVTGLIWTKTSVEKKSWTDAQTYCSGLPQAGTWRLPKRHELHSLVDYGTDRIVKIDEKLDGPLNNPTVYMYWTSTEAAIGGGSTVGICVEFDTGHVRRMDKDTQLWVRCVSP